MHTQIDNVEELVVFPESDPKTLHSGAINESPLIMLMSVVAYAMFHC